MSARRPLPSRPLRAVRPGAALALVVALAAGSAAAQSFTGAGPSVPFALPREEGGRRPPAEVARPDSSIRAAEEPRHAASAPREAAPQGVLRHLPRIAGDLRIAGEVGAREWPVYVTEAQARQRLKFRVGYLSAVSAMPEASLLSVSVNGRIVGQARIKAPNAVRVVEFDLSPGLLRPGFNQMQVAVEHRHRVDCSIAATHELWTQIDPAETGLVLPSAPSGVGDLADLPALPPDATGALPIRVLLAGKTSRGNVERILRATQAVALAGRFEHPVVEFGPPAAGAHGLNLVVGAGADLAALGDLGPVGPVTGPSLALLPGDAGRRATLLVTGATDAEVDLALAQLAERREPAGTPEGLRALKVARGYPVEGGERVRLGELGLASQEFSGRLFRVSFNVAMPADLLGADYGKVLLNLAGGYASGLTGAQVIVDVNGRNAASLLLPKAAGDVFRENQIPLPLGAWRPGLNRVEITAELPAPADRACDTLAASQRKRFLFLDSTELVVPALGRVARLPDLAAAASGGFANAAPGHRPVLVVPAPDKDSLGAAVTLATRLAVSARAPIDFAFLTRRGADEGGPMLLVAPARALDPSLMGTVGVDAGAVRAAWEPRTEEVPGRRAEGVSRRMMLERNLPPSCGLARGAAPRTAIIAGAAQRPPAARPDEPPTLVSAPPRNLEEEWEARRESGRWWRKARTAIVDASGAVQGGVADAWAQAAAWTSGRLGPEEGPPTIAPQASLIVGQNLVAPDIGSGGDRLVTLVTAPNPALLAASVTCLTDPIVWSGLSGRMAVLDAADGSLVSVAARGTRFVATQPPSVGNLRLVAAGWLSLNPFTYAGLALVLALLLSASTMHLVRNVGRRGG